MVGCCAASVSCGFVILVCTAHCAVDMPGPVNNGSLLGRNGHQPHRLGKVERARAEERAACAML